MSRGTYWFLPGISKDVLSILQHVSKGGGGGGVPESLRFLSIFKIKVKLPLPSQVTQNTEVVGNCLLRNWRSKYDLGEKFGDEVNRAINPASKFTSKQPENSDSTRRAPDKCWKAELELHLKQVTTISSGPGSCRNPKRKSICINNSENSLSAKYTARL